jgi:hypothetical protein
MPTVTRNSLETKKVAAGAEEVLAVAATADLAGSVAAGDVRNAGKAAVAHGLVRARVVRDRAAPEVHLAVVRAATVAGAPANSGGVPEQTAARANGASLKFPFRNWK